MSSKRFCVCAVVMMACVLCLTCGAGFAAMRNVLMDFRDAIIKRDSEAAQAAIKAGVNPVDAVERIILTNPSPSEDDFFVPLVKALAKKGKFKGVSLYTDSGEEGRDPQGNYRLGRAISSNKVMEALLDGGADPDKVRRLRDRSTGTEFDSNTTLLFETLQELREKPVITKDDFLLERVNILAKYKASLKSVGIVGGLFASILGGTTEAMCFFLKGRDLENTRSLTDKNLSSIVNVMSVLRDAGGGTGEAKDYMKNLREKYRNIPDALKYIDKVEASFKSSSWFSW